MESRIGSMHCENTVRNDFGILAGDERPTRGVPTEQHAAAGMCESGFPSSRPESSLIKGPKQIASIYTVIVYDLLPPRKDLRNHGDVQRNGIQRARSRIDAMPLPRVRGNPLHRRVPRMQGAPDCWMMAPRYARASALCGSRLSQWRTIGSAAANWPVERSTTESQRRQIASSHPAR